MSTVRRVAANTGFIIVGDVIFKIISLVVTIYLARYLGTVGFGKYSFIFAYLAFFGVISDLGLQTILVREMARNPSTAPKLIGNAFIIRLILTVLAIVLSVVVISLISYPKDTTTYIYIAAFMLLFLSFSSFYSTIFQANLSMQYNVIAKLVFRVLSATLIFWVIFSHGSLMQVIIALVFSEMVKTVISYSFSRKIVRPRFEIDFGLWRYLFKEALPLALYSVIWIIYFRIDVVMLSFMQGDAAVGFYSAAYKLSEPLSLIPQALMISLFPVMSASFKTSKERLIKSCRLAIKYILIIVIPIALGTTLLANKLILLIYGAEFTGSVNALQILIWSLVFTSVTYVLTNLLISMGKQKLNTISIIFCAAINTLLNFVLISIMSYNGAAIATLATSTVFCGASFYFVSKYFQEISILKITIKPITCALIMGAFVYYFIDFSIYLLIPSAGIVYLITLFALRTFTKEDMDMFKKVAGKK